MIEDNIPDELKSCEQWVNWKNVKKKIPYTPDKITKAASSTDSKTWGSFGKAVENVNKSKAKGVGFVLTNSDPYLVIDIDHCIDKKGNLHPVAEFWIELFNSYTEISPSQTGIHIFIKGDSIGTGRKLECKFSASGLGFEIYSSARYMTVTGNIEPLYEDCGELDFNPSAIRLFYETYFHRGRKASVWRPCDGKMESGDRNSTMQKVIGSMARVVAQSVPDDYTAEEKEQVLETIINHYNDEYTSPPLSDKEIDNQLKSASKYLDQRLKETEDMVMDDEEYEYKEEHEDDEEIPVGKKLAAKLINRFPFIAIQNKFLDRNSNSLVSREAVTIMTGHYKLYIKDKDGEPKRTDLPNVIKFSGKKILADNLTWSPARDELTTDEESRILLNTYKKLSTKDIPAKTTAKDIRPFLELAEYVIHDAKLRQLFIEYLAFTLQYPEIKINYGILIGSEYEGVGKDLLLRPAVNFMGGQCKEISADMLHGQFNEYLYKTKLLIIQEIYTSDRSDKRSLESGLKPLLAGPPDTLMINSKNDKLVPVDNVVSVIMTTNHDDAIPISDANTNRRYLAIWSDVKPKEPDFYISYLEWQNNGGWQHVVRYMLNLDVEAFDYTHSPVKTEYLDSLSKNSKDMVYHNLEFMIARKELPFAMDLMSVEDIMAGLHEHGMRYVTRQGVMKALKALNVRYYGSRFIDTNGKEQNEKKYKDGLRRSTRSGAVSVASGRAVNVKLYCTNPKKYDDLNGREIMDAYLNGKTAKFSAKRG